MKIDKLSNKIKFEELKNNYINYLKFNYGKHFIKNKLYFHGLIEFNNNLYVYDMDCIEQLEPPQTFNLFKKLKYWYYDISSNFNRTYSIFDNNLNEIKYLSSFQLLKYKKYDLDLNEISNIKFIFYYLQFFFCGLFR